MDTGALFAPATVGFALRPRAALRLERTSTALQAAGLGLLIGIAGTLTAHLAPTVPWWPWWSLGAAVAVWAAIRWARLKVAWRWSGFSLTGTDLWVRTGLWSRHLESLAYGRIQTITVSAGPLQRRFGLATVTVATGSY
ncbi:PH domain-containing protein [Kitasatospora sp. MBT66]|uniref:PH domain-containing protein n=1 Tax=Kitasatospora sp. MBT66 TaxID=1444769 RepID=UPI00068D6292|nr:PH domain-containing protein [Kitasatospora sp. MBT66]